MSHKYKKSFVSSQKQHTINVKKAITYQELAIQVQRQLATRYPENEARWMTRIVFEEINKFLLDFRVGIINLGLFFVDVIRGNLYHNVGRLSIYRP